MTSGRYSDTPRPEVSSAIGAAPVRVTSGPIPIMASLSTTKAMSGLAGTVVACLRAPRLQARAEREVRPRARLRMKGRWRALWVIFTTAWS